MRGGRPYSILDLLETSGGVLDAFCSELNLLNVCRLLSCGILYIVRSSVLLMVCLQSIYESCIDTDKRTKDR